MSVVLSAVVVCLLSSCCLVVVVTIGVAGLAGSVNVLLTQSLYMVFHVLRRCKPSRVVREIIVISVNLGWL